MSSRCVLLIFAKVSSGIHAYTTRTFDLCIWLQTGLQLRDLNSLIWPATNSHAWTRRRSFPVTAFCCNVHGSNIVCIWEAMTLKHCREDDFQADLQSHEFVLEHVGVCRIHVNVRPLASAAWRLKWKKSQKRQTQKSRATSNIGWSISTDLNGSRGFWWCQSSRHVLRWRWEFFHIGGCSPRATSPWRALLRCCGVGCIGAQWAIFIVQHQYHGVCIPLFPSRWTHAPQHGSPQHRYDEASTSTVCSRHWAGQRQTRVLHGNSAQMQTFSVSTGSCAFSVDTCAAACHW